MKKDEQIATVLREYGAAFRGAWGDIDGRSIKQSLDTVAAMIKGESDDPFTLERLRYHLDLCPTGGGHWTTYCDESWIECPADEPAVVNA